MKAKIVKLIENIYIYLMFLFMYIPIIVLMIFSFNDAKSRGVWGGFSFKWYQEMFSDAELMTSLQTTLIVGVVSAIISCIIGTAAAIGIRGFRNKKIRGLINQITNIPMVSSELVLGISLMLLFIAIKIPTGMFTMILAHITFCVPYVILSVSPKLMQLDDNLYEAAVDLGAKPWYAFKKVVLPEIMPGIVNGLLIAFTMSIDDFVISFFTAGNGITNLSMYVYATAKRLNPKINALSTVMFLVIMLLLFIINKRTSKDKDSNVLLR